MPKSFFARGPNPQRSPKSRSDALTAGQRALKQPLRVRLRAYFENKESKHTVENFASKTHQNSSALAGRILLPGPASITYSPKSKLSEIRERCRLTFDAFFRLGRDGLRAVPVEFGHLSSFGIQRRRRDIKIA